MIQSSFPSADTPETPALSGKHQKFVEAIASGLGNHQAYLAAYPGAAPGTAKSQAWRLLARPDVQAVLARLRKESESAAVMTLQEKRAYLALVVRTSAAEAPRDSGLIQEVKVNADGSETYRLPNKLRAIYLDCRLAGEIIATPKPSPQAIGPETEEATTVAAIRQVTHVHAQPPLPDPHPQTHEPQSRSADAPVRPTKPKAHAPSSPPSPPTAPSQSEAQSKDVDVPVRPSEPPSAPKEVPSPNAASEPPNQSPEPRTKNGTWVPQQQHINRRYCGVPPEPPEPPQDPELRRRLYGSKA